MLDVKIVSTPIVGHFKLFSSQSPKIHEEYKFMSKTPYASCKTRVFCCIFIFIIKYFIMVLH